MTVAGKAQRAGRSADPTEAPRRLRLAELNPGAGRAELERRHGRVWSPTELAREFEVVGFMAPYAVVRRRSDGATGSLEFQHEPRFYFNWRKDEEEA
jgi:hypothetical protein